MRRVLGIAVAALAFAGGCARDAGPGAAPAAEPRAVREVPEHPTFARDVAGIVWRHCAPCHREGEVGPFPLVDHRDVRKRAEQILEVVEDGYMPPWLPEPGYVELRDERRLSAAEIETLRRFVRDGAPAGDPGELPPMPQWTEGWQLGEPDLVVELEEAFAVPADGDDVIRNFVLPIPVTGRHLVAAFELRPGNARVVHHAIVQVDRTGAARAADAGDPEPGFPGMAMAGSQPPAGHFVGWTPGKRPTVLPGDMAWPLEPGTDLVLQLHLVTTGKPESVRPRIGLHFTDREPERRAYPLVLWSEAIDIPAGAAEWTLREEFTLPVAVEVIGCYPHAHYLGRRLHGKAILPDGATQWLIRIDDWDFDWQDDYRYAEPFRLPAGTRLSIEYVYDNSADNPRNPSQPPRRVRFGDRSIDEMGTLTLSVVPEDDDARFALEVARWEDALRKKPWDWAAHDALGVLLATRGRFEAAEERLRAALALRPDYADAWNDLGMVARSTGRLPEAVRCFRKAAECDASHRNAHRNLARALADGGDVDAGVAVLESFVARHAALIDLRFDLADLLAIHGRPKAAIAHYEAVLEQRGDVPEVHNNLANTWLFGLGEPRRAEHHYRRALAVRPDYFNARLNLARALLQAGDRTAAATELEAAARQRPDDPGVQALQAAAAADR